MAKVEWFKDLLVEDLSGVTFVRDYVQLQFNPNPMLNVYTPITVTSAGLKHVSGEPEFANALIDQINKFVADVTIEPATSISIHFRDGLVISFSTRREDVTYEALTLSLRQERCTKNSERPNTRLQRMELRTAAEVERRAARSP